MMIEKKITPFDSNVFLFNFKGMEDVAWNAISSFIDFLPELTSAIAIAIESKNSGDLEIAAHTLKGALSIFYAGPSQQLASKLEEMGHNLVTDNTELVFNGLVYELEILKKALCELLEKNRN